MELAASDVSTSTQWRLNDPGARASQFRAQIQATQFNTQKRAAGRPDYCRGLERNGVDQIAGNLYATAQTFIAVGNNCANANGSPLIPNVAVKFDESIVRAGISYKFGS